MTIQIRHKVSYDSIDTKTVLTQVDAACRAVRDAVHEVASAKIRAEQLYNQRRNDAAVPDDLQQLGQMLSRLDHGLKVCRSWSDEIDQLAHAMHDPTERPLEWVVRAAAPTPYTHNAWVSHYGTAEILADTLTDLHGIKYEARPQ